MFDVLKFVTFLAGCAAIYGLATGADLNHLFSEITEQAVPVLQKVVASILDLFKNAAG